jgi:coproporphyrinogen III oxidase
MIREGQDSICKAIEEVDGTKFRTDAWTRPAGGGGITRVMQVGSPHLRHRPSPEPRP